MRISRRFRHIHTGGAQDGCRHWSEPEVAAQTLIRLARMEKIGQVRFCDFEVVSRLDLHLRQTVASGVHELWRPEERIRGATVHDEPLHLVEDLPNPEQAQRMLGLLGRELDHRRVRETEQSPDVLFKLGAMTRPRTRRRYLSDEGVVEGWLLGASERRQIRADVVGRRKPAATSRKRKKGSLDSARAGVTDRAVSFAVVGFFAN